MNEDFIIFITAGVWPLDAGARMHSHGLAEAFSDDIDVKVFTWQWDNMDLTVMETGKYSLQTYDRNQCRYRGKYNLSCRIFSKLTGYYGVNPEMLSDILKEAGKTACKYIFIDQIQMYGYFLVLRKMLPSKKIIYISHNAESVNCKEGMRKPYDSWNTYFAALKRSAAVQYAERDLLRHADYVFSISPQDTAWFQKHIKNHCDIVYAKPLIKFQQGNREERIQTYNKKILFVGSMFWYPNVAGVEWFVDNVFKKILEKDSEYILYIVGSDPTESIRKLGEQFPNNVVVTGRVPDVNVYYDLCDVCVIPLFDGMGAKIKVLEAIAYEIPTIMTDYAATGYDLDREAVIANSGQEFYEAILQMEDYDNRIELQRNCRTYYSGYLTLSDEIKSILTKN